MLIQIPCQLSIVILIARKIKKNVWYDTNMVGKYVDKVFVMEVIPWEWYDGL